MSPASVAAPRRVRDRRADQADAEQRELFENGLAAHPRATNSCKRLDDLAVGVLGADGEAQAIRQSVGQQRHAGSGRARRGTRRPRRPRPCLRNGSARNCPRCRPRASRACGCSAISQLRHVSLCATAGLDMGAVLQRGGRCELRGNGDIERPADAVQHVGDLRRAIGPADAQPREAIAFSRRSASSRRWRSCATSSIPAS